MLGPLAVFALFLNLSRYHFEHLGDDAFIAFRYAANLAHGLGPVWNPGERVEGFSSPLWILLLSLGARAGIELPLWSKILGELSSALVVLGAALSARSLGMGFRGSTLVALATTLLHGLHFWAPAGLETALFSALLLWSVLALSSDRLLVSSILAGMVGITRPEGPLLALLLLVLTALRARGRLRAILPQALLALGPALGYQAFRMLYYGLPFANTAYAKVTGETLERLHAGLIYTLPALIPWAFLLGASLLSRASRGGRITQITRLDGPGRAEREALLVAGTLLLAVLIAGGDWMHFSRMLLPALVLLPGLALGLLLSTRPGVPARALALLSLIALWPQLTPPRLLYKALRGQDLPPEAWQEGTLVLASQSVGRWMKERLPDGATIAVNHAGVIPFILEDAVAIDMAGLCDAHIAQEVEGGLHAKWDADYVLSREPDMVVLNTRISPTFEGPWYTPGYWEGETALFEHPEFKAHYRAIPEAWGRVARGGSKAWIVLYERLE